MVVLNHYGCNIFLATTLWMAALLSVVKICQTDAIFEEFVMGHLLSLDMLHIVRYFKEAPFIDLR